MNRDRVLMYAVVVLLSLLVGIDAMMWTGETECTMTGLTTQVCQYR